MNQDQEPDYRQQLGLKKILYKYQNQNQQLRSQIKALNQRLQSIVNKPKTPQKKQPINPIQQYQGQLLKQQMKNLYAQINKQTQQMKINKDGIDERHERKCKEIQNKIIKQEKQIKELKHKLERYEKLDEGISVNAMLTKGNMNLKEQSSNLNNNNATQNINAGNLGIDTSLLLMSNNKTLRNSTIRVQSYLQKLSAILQQTQTVRKSIKELEHQRDSNERVLIKKHTYQTDVKGQNRVLQFGKTEGVIAEESFTPRKPGVWGLENTQENYEMIRKQLDNLKKEKDNTLSTIKNQNIVLQNKIKELQSQLEGLNKSVQIPPLPYQKRPMKIPIDLSDLSVSQKLQSPLIMRKSLKPLDIGPTQFQRNNDKNFVPKKMRKVQWQSTKNKSGIQWYDSQLKSPIIGLNLWFDGHLLGVQFIHQMGNSSQHLQIMGGKKIIPIQYRLGANDYLENLIIYISQGLINGIQLISKNGRNDKFGNFLKSRKHDFGIKAPEKPVISFGQFRINGNNVSQITKLGFQVI